MSVQFEEKTNNALTTALEDRDGLPLIVVEDMDKGRGNGSDIALHAGADGANAKFSVIEIKFFRKFGLSEQEELLSSWDCRLDLYVPRNGKLFLSRHPTQGGHICFSSCKLNKSNVKRCIPLAEVVHMEKKEATITNLKYYGVRGICFHFSDGTLLQFSRFEDRDGAWDMIREEWERARTITGNDKLQRENQLQEEEANRKKKKKKKEVVCTNPPIKKKNKKKKKEVVPSASSCGLLMLTILEARNLPRTYMSHVGFVEPCCTLAFGTQTFQTEAAGRNKGTCKWNEKFNIAVYSHEEATTLVLTIDDGENRIIGTYQAPITDFLEPLTPIDKWIVLETQQSKGFYFDAQAQFQVHIRSEFKAKEEIQHIFWKECVSVFDSDNDGKVDFTEAMSMLKVLGCGLPEDEINELYHVIDVNNDGAISPDDLVRFSASGSGGLISLLVKRCPLCGYHLSTVEEEVIYHLGVCVFDDISKNLLVRMMVVPLGSVLRMSKKKLKKGKKAPSFLVMDRQTGKLIPEIIPQRVRVLMKTVYGNKIGKKVMLTNRAIRLLERASINQGMKFDHPSSVKDIDIFIRYYKLDTNELADPIESFGCFNEFFYRKLRAGARPVTSPDDPEVCVAAADARLMVFNNVSEATRLWIKGRNFSIESLLDDEQLAETFKGGSIAVYRLAPQDYHRFHMPVDGQLGAPRSIAGNYHTVNPLAINSQVLNVFTENKRTITLIDSPQFGTVAYIAIGATLVGSIIHTCGDGDTLRRGDEVGYFAFGGSTIITLFTKGAIKFDDDLLLNSAQPLETLVRMGERVGRKRTPEDKDGYDLMYEDNGGLSPMEGDESDAIGTEGEDDLLGGLLSVSVSGSGGKDTINRTSPDYSAALLDDGLPGQPRTPSGEKKNFATKTKNTIMLGTKLISPKKFKGKKNSSRDDSASDIGSAIANATKEGSVSPPTQRRDRKRDKRDAVHQQSNGGASSSSSGGGKRGSRIWRRKDSNDNNKKYAEGKKEGSADMYLAGEPFSRSLPAIRSSTASGSSSPAGLRPALIPQHHSQSSFYGHSSTSSSLAASHGQLAEHHHRHMLHHQYQQQHHHQRHQQHRFVLPLSTMINADTAPSSSSHALTSSPPRSPRSPPSYPQTTPTGSPVHTPRPSTPPQPQQPMSFSPGDVYATSAFVPPSPFYSVPLSPSPCGTPATDRLASLAQSREQRRHAQEEIEAVEMYELSTAYAIEGFVFDHIGGSVRSPHHHHASRYGEGDDEDDGLELDHAPRSSSPSLSATDNVWSKGKEISSDTPQQSRRRTIGKSADDAGKPGGSRAQPSAGLARTDGKPPSSPSPVWKNRVHHNNTMTTSTTSSSSSVESDVKAKHERHHHLHHNHHRHAHQQDEMTMVLTEDEDKGRSTDERFGGGLDEDDDHRHHHHHSRDHKRPQQVYPPPGHPYLYQLAPYTFDLDDCFEDEYDEVDDQMFGELKRELELEQLHASGELECL